MVRHPRLCGWGVRAEDEHGYTYWVRTGGRRNGTPRMYTSVGRAEHAIKTTTAPLKNPRVVELYAYV